MRYRKGSIVRIYLEDFVTFDSIELKPKNKLNLIVGANGSGKSTFVCAIVLGLGGNPKIIGRSPNVSDYVKHGQEKAIIDLELFNPDGDNFLISRHITNSSQSSWFLQNRSVPFKRVEALIADLNIQINNLCQVLPQDRVQDFAKMNQKELLENTQKSIGDPQMCEWFSRLINFRSSIMDREKNLSEKTKKFESELQKNKRMEADVKSYQEKQDTVEKVSVIKKKLAWMLYEEKNETRKKIQEDYKSAQATYEKLKSELQPLLKKIQEAERAHQSVGNKIKAENDHNASLNNEIKNFIRKHNRCKDELDSIKQELRSILEGEAQKEAQIAEIDKRIAEIEQNMASHNYDALNKGIKDAEQKIESIISKLSQARNTESEIRDRAMAVNQSMRALEHKVQQLNSVREKKLEILSRFEDVRKAYDWLEQNRHMFKKNVYGPVFMELDVKNPNVSRYIEHIVSGRDLLAFVFEDPKEMSHMLRILRDGKKLKINAVTSTPLQHSLSETFCPRVPLSQLRNLGFESYILNQVDGPDSVLKYLCQNFQFHNIPFGSNQIENNLDHIPTDLRMFFTENTFYGVSYSKYSGEKLQKVTKVGSAKFLSTSVNKDLLNSCNEELTRKKAEYLSIQNRLTELAEMKNRFDIEVNSLRNRKKEFLTSLEYVKQSSVRLRLQKEQRAEIAGRKIDPLREEAKAKQKMQTCVKEMILNETEAARVIGRFSDSSTAIRMLKMELECLKATIRKREQDSKQLEESTVNAKNDVENLKLEFAQIRGELKDLHSKAKEMCEGLDPSDERFKQKYMPLFRELPVNRESLEDVLHETIAMVKCFQGSFDDKVIKDYEASTKLLKTLEKEIDRLKAAASGMQEEADETLNSWLPKIEELIDRINDRFGAFFAAMGCAGVVELDRGQNHTVYENYGLRIKVKFRNEGEMQALDAHTQSGGERALTTAVYLLSLQAITNVPFRCVDEINQGMDEINEKRVYHLIMNSISTCDTAQYFLVTPTLFANVQYPDGTAVHCIHAASSDKENMSFVWNKQKYFSTLGIC